MDCAAEESLVRMGLNAVPSVQALEFDLSARQVAVYHLGDLKCVVSAMDGLGLGLSHIETMRSDPPVGKANDQRRLLWTVLLINLAFFAIEMTTGLISKSIGLVADSLDMLADALVYGMSLLAVGTNASRKKAVAR